MVGRRRLVGYVQKDYGKSHYSLDNHNFSDSEIRDAAQEYVAQSNDPFKMRIPMTPVNFLTLAHRFYLETFEGLPPPQISQMLTYMVQRGRFLPSPHFLKYNQRVNLENAQIIWQTVHNSADVSPADISTLFFGVGDPGNDIYGLWNFKDAVHHAEAAILDGDDLGDEIFVHPNLLGFSNGNVAPPPPSLSVGFMPFSPQSSHFASAQALAVRTRPPRSGGLSAGPAPFTGLSPQTRALLAHRSAAISENALITRDVYTTSTQAHITHDKINISSDDEYKKS